MENQESETANNKTSKNSEFAKTQTYLGKQSKGKNDAKFRSTGTSIKLPYLANNTLSSGFKTSFYQSPHQMA